MNLFQNKVGIRVGNKVGYSQHNSHNDGIMYNITNILATFCKLYFALTIPFFVNNSKIKYICVWKI